jgi:hypothetical protein
VRSEFAPRTIVTASIATRFDRVQSLTSRTKTKQNKTKQNKTKQNKTKQNKTKQNHREVIANSLHLKNEAFQEGQETKGFLQRKEQRQETSWSHNDRRCLGQRSCIFQVRPCDQRPRSSKESSNRWMTHPTFLMSFKGSFSSKKA